MAEVERRFVELNAAYEVLRDAELRALLDAERAARTLCRARGGAGARRDGEATWRCV